MSLKDCLKKHKIEKHEKAILRGMIDGMSEQDMDEHAAAVAAVKERIDDIESSIQAVKAQIAEAGGEIPKPGSRTPDGYEASGERTGIVGEKVYEQIGEFKIGDQVRARGKEVGEVRRMFVVDGRSRAEVRWPASEEYPRGSMQNVDIKGLKRVEEAPALSSYSQADLEQRDADVAAGQKRREDEDKAAERKAKADRDLPNFTLTGSDRAADANPDQDVLFSRSQSPWYYSVLHRVIEQKGSTATPAEWAQRLDAWQKSGAFKADELEAVGLKDWLDLQSGKVTKQQVLGYLDEGGVKLEETVLGGERNAGVGQAALIERFARDGYTLDYEHGEIDVTDSEGNSVEYGELPIDLRNAIDAEDRALTLSAQKTPKFAQYTLPGGKNYSELLLTLPKRPGRYEVRIGDGMWRIWNNDNNDWARRPDGKLLSGYQTEEDARRGMSVMGGSEANNFRSGHWDQPNILAHIRFNERTDAEGKRVLFVEEIQSDWAQKGKKEGFGHARKLNIVGFKWDAATSDWVRANDAEATHFGDSSSDNDTVWSTRAEAESRLSPASVPSAPFVTKTEAWVALALKRMIRYAAENGFDKIAFTNGEQQAARYDLSKQISKVQATKTLQGHYAIKAISNNGIVVLDDVYTTEKLPDVIGKDLAQKVVDRADAAADGSLLKSLPDDFTVSMDRQSDPENPFTIIPPGQVHGQPYAGRHATEAEAKQAALEQANRERRRTVDLTGLDLKVGGEGMRAFYDKIVPNVANDVLKKIGGGKITTVALEKGDQRKRRDEVLAELGKPATPDLQQPGFDITPKMREMAMQGLPLFKRGAQQGGVKKADLEQALAPVIAGWANGPSAVKVVQSYDGLPKRLYDLGVAEGAIGPGAALHAVYDNQTKSVYLIADQLDSIEHGQRALLHETLGHFGLRSILGKEHYTSTMRRVFFVNSQIRAQAQAQMKAYGYPQDLATEEALADLAATGESFSGIKQIMAAIQRWLRDHGMGGIADWLEARTGAESAREHEKTGILHLLSQARAFVETGDKPHFYTPQMAAAFSRSPSLRRFAFPKEADPPIATFSGETAPMKAHPDYVAAKAGDRDAAVRTVGDLVTEANTEQARKRFGADVIYVAVHGEEATGKNKLPDALASYYALKTGGQVDDEIIQSNRPHHTGAKPMERLISPVEFAGAVKAGARYVLVDDVATLGGTFASLADHIQRGGGEVVGSVVLVNAGRIDTMAADPKITAELERRYGDEIRSLFGIEPAALTSSEAQYLIGFRSADELRNRATAAREERRQRLLSKGISEEGLGDTAFSRSATAGPLPVDPADNAARLLPRAYKSWARRTSDRVANALDLFGDLEGKNDLLTIRNLAKGKIGTADELVKEIKKAFDHGSPADAKAAYAFFTSAGADPATITNQAVREAAVNAKDTINHIGDQLVEAGLITEEARAAHDDSYLPQLYLQFLADTGAYKHIGGGKRPSDFGYTKGRKIEKVIGPDGEPQLFWKGQDGAAQTPLTREEVLALGPINDPGFLASMAIARPMRDMALLDYMEQIANDERWVLPGSVVEWNGKTVSAMWLKQRADLMRRNADQYEQADADEARAIAAQMDAVAEEGLGKQVATKDYAQIPNSARWGMLRGMWVRKEIVEDLQGLAGMQEAPTNFFSDWFWYGGKGTRVTQFWKAMKVSLNLPGQIRNYLSNNVTMFMSGVPAYRLPDLNFRAWHEYLSKGELYQQAKATGIFHGTFANQELSRFKRDLVDLELKTKGMHPMRRLVALAEKLQDFGGDIYGAVEGVMKLAVIMDRMGRLNMTIDQAALEADKWLIDYSNVPNAVRQMRGAPIGVSFITYPYKMLPLIVETALERPHKLVALYALGKGLTLAAAAMLHVEPDDIDKLKLALPEWLQKNGAVLFIPWKDEQGRWRFFDASYFLPWTYFSNLAKGAGGVVKDVAEGGSGVGKLPDLMGDVGAAGGPIPSILIALKTNVDPFTKREITTKGAPANVQMLELMNYTYDMMAPPMFTSSGFVSPMGLADRKFGGKLTQAVSGQTNKFGDPRATTTQAFSSLFGMNVYPVDPERSRAQNMKKMAREIDDVKTAAKKAMTDRSLTSEQKREIGQDYVKEATRRSRLLRDYADRSKVPERLK